MRRQREREKKQAAGPVELPSQDRPRGHHSRRSITIQELANRMAERAVDVIKLLMQQGQMMKINDILDADTAQLHRRGNRAYSPSGFPKPTSRMA